MKRSKYRAKPCVIDGIRFASQREGSHYLDLKLRERAGEITELELQPRYPLYSIRASNGEAIKVCDYVADFRFRELPDRVLVVQDVKGMKTPMYRLKAKMVRAQYGIQVQEV